jgi:hypothetical protein
MTTEEAKTPEIAAAVAAPAAEPAKTEAEPAKTDVLSAVVDLTEPKPAKKAKAKKPRDEDDD